MTCKIKEFLKKRDTECTTPRCDLCWYKEKFEDLRQDAEMVRKEIERECGQDIWE